MPRISDKLIWLIGVPLFVFGLLKGGVHWYTTHQLDRMILDAAPWITISYGDLDTSLAGRIDIEDIRAVPVGQSDAVRIAHMSVQGPDIFNFLLEHNPVTGEQVPPEFLNVVVRDLNLDASLISNLDDSYRFSLPQQAWNAPAVCGAPGSLSLGMLKDMGHDKLSADGRLFYRYTEKKQELRGNLELDVHDIQSLSMGLTLGNVSPHALKYGTPGMPWLNELRMTMDIDPGFGRQVSAYCAEKTGKTVTEYQEHAAELFLQNLANNGIELGWGLETAVRSYYKEWGEIDIALSPLTPLNILGLMLNPPDDIEQTLGLQVAVNNQLLTDLDFSLIENAKLFVREPQEQKKAVTRPRYRMVWKSIPTGKLMEYRDRTVKLYVTDRPVRKGVLIGTEGDRVLVEQRVSSGKFTAHVPRRNIYKAEARVRVRVNPPSTTEQGMAKQAYTQQTQSSGQQAEHTGRH